MTPSLGRIVLVKVDPKRNNGADIAPAIITRVWGADQVNLKVIGDSDQNEWKTSVKLFDTEEEARGYEATACFWPPRV